MSFLKSRAMLVRLSVSQWGARRLDKSATAEIVASHNARSDAARVNKRLVSAAALGEIGKIESEARIFHYLVTLPWLDSGARILPAAAFLTYSEKMRNFRQRFESSVAAFLAVYDDAITAARQSLGTMFCESDYPSETEIRRKFAFSHDILPYPDSSDFRVEIAEEQAAEIRSQIDSRLADALGAAMREPWQRIAEHVGKMAERLKAYKPGSEGTRAENIFRDSLVENVRELSALLPVLNITGDSRLAEIAERIRAELCQDDASALRDNPNARASVAASAESIMATVGDYFQ